MRLITYILEFGYGLLLAVGIVGVVVVGWQYGLRSDEWQGWMNLLNIHNGIALMYYVAKK